MSENHVTSLDCLHVKKTDALKIITENKAKHDKILADAIEGYWIDAEKVLKQLKVDRLKELKKQYQKNVKDFKKQISSDLGLVSKRKKDGSFIHLRQRFPEDHSDDYVGVIKRLELAVGENIELDSTEFDKYIRNKWSWRESFITTNSYYSNISGACYISGITGSCLTNATSGLYYNDVSSSYSFSSVGLNSKIGVGVKDPDYKFEVGGTKIDF